MTSLPIHPHTRLRAIGLRRDGRPIWPVAGGSQPVGDPPAPTGPVPPVPAAPPTPPAPEPPKPDDAPLGPAGMKALQEEREARKALEKQLAGLAPLQKLADALGAGKPEAGGKSEIELLNERFAEHEKTVTTEREARWRAEVAHEKGLTPAQAGRLTGSTREALLADADALVALFPPAGPRTPGPDPSQGARGTPPGVDLDTQIREAQSKGDWRTVITLQNQKLANHKP